MVRAGWTTLGWVDRESWYKEVTVKPRWEATGCAQKTAERPVSESSGWGAWAVSSAWNTPPLKPHGWLLLIIQTWAPVSSPQKTFLTSRNFASPPCQVVSTHYPDLFLQSSSHHLKLPCLFLHLLIVCFPPLEGKSPEHFVQYRGVSKYWLNE